MLNLKRITSLTLSILMLLSVWAFQIPSSAAEMCYITFDANGGTGMPATVSVAAGTVIYLPASAPKRPGMVFMGWAFSQEKADCGDITYAANTTPQILVNSSAVLYASWAYPVYLNHGTQGWGSEAFPLYKFPSVDLDLYHHKDTIFQNYGMLPGAYGDMGRLDVFVEWNTNQLANGKGNGTAYHEKYTTNAPATLYAVWGNPIVYNADGGTFPVTGSEIQEEFVVGTSTGVTDSTKFGFFNMPTDDNAPYKAGARQYKVNGEEVYARVFTNGDIYRFETSESWLEIPIFNLDGYSWSDFYTTTTSYLECGLELYTIWEPSVTYKANGGSGKDVVEYMTFKGDALYSYEDYTVLGNSFTNSSAFIGWNTKPDGTGTSYAAGDVINDYDNSDPLILYAQWKNSGSRNSNYTVSFNAMEGYLDFDKQYIEIAYGESYSSKDIPVPTRVGYIFKGWYNTATGSYLMDNELYSLNGDTSFDAVYELHNNHILDCFKKQANCWYEGYFSTSCAACSYSDTLVYEKVPHNYSNWNFVSGSTAVKRVCQYCLAEEGADSTATVKQEIIAYANKSGQFGYSDFQYVDVCNYIGATVYGGAGETVFQGSDFSNANYIRQNAKAVNPNLKFVLTIYNGNVAKFESWLKSSSTRASFADTLVNTVVAYGFDGLDIDFEFPADLTLKDDFAALLGDIRTRFNMYSASNGKQYLLTIATPASNWSYEKFDLVACSQYLDFFNIMNYDLYCGSAFPYTHHHTPPYDNQDPYGHILTGGSVQSDVAMYKSLGIPAEKIVPGMGLYSREWTGVGSNNNGLFQAGSLQASNYHYDQIVSSFVNQNGYTRYWDDTAKAPYLYNPYQGIFLSYDDPDSIRYKCEIAQRERVRGVMVFDYITCDSIGIFGYIDSMIGSLPHACSVGRYDTKNVSCEENGYQTAYCGVCGAAMGHTEIYREGHLCNDWTVSTAPSANSKGELTGSCIICGKTLTKTLDALGYTVTFNGNGGSVKSSTKYLVKKGETYLSALGGTPTAERDGFEFAGWYCSEKNYTLNTSDTFKFNNNITFTAQWSGGDHVHSYNKTVTEADCVNDGVITYTCSCGDSYTETIPATGHSYGDWYTVKEPTVTSTGTQRRDCSKCDSFETKEIPVLEDTSDKPVVATENYDIKITKADTFTYIRYAAGTYTTASAIKNAAGCVTLSASKIASLTTNGVCTLT
ncbi:MAG: InlB B-repeat-containing protein, partial [Clostridia bacterium]|nr:InlB B-repeat-containing protein [Clostridia bacterium]